MKLHDFHPVIRLSHVLCEGVATFIFIFLGILSILFWMGMPLGKTLIASESTRFIVVILSFALISMGLSYSVFAKISGAHLNPAVSFAFYLEGHIGFLDFLGYMVAQISAALGACFLLSKLCPESAELVQLGRVKPQEGMPNFIIFTVEAFSIMVILLAAFYCLHHERLIKWTGAIVAALVFSIVYLTAPLTGAGLNPARVFAPAYLTHHLNFSLWVYSLAPFIGSLMAVSLARYGEMIERRTSHPLKLLVFFLKRPHFFRFNHEEGYVEKVFEKLIQPKPPSRS